MSVIKRKPKIQEILEMLNEFDLNELLYQIDEQISEPFFSLIDNKHKMYDLAELADDEDYSSEVMSMRLELDSHKILNGIATRCLKRIGDEIKRFEYFLNYDNSQRITIYTIDTLNKSYKICNDYCDITELRFEIYRVLNQMSQGVYTGGGTHLYKHELSGTFSGASGAASWSVHGYVITTSNIPITYNDFFSEVGNAISRHIIMNGRIIICLNPLNNDAFIAFDAIDNTVEYLVPVDGINPNTYEVTDHVSAI